jgi:methyl-accepting chemotaxis protein
MNAYHHRDLQKYIFLETTPNKSMTGKDVKGLKDKNNVFLIQELLKKEKTGGGFVTYIGDKPGKGDTNKVSYAQMIPGTDFWIEIYNIDALQKGMAAEISGKVKDSITQMILVAGVVFAGKIVLFLIIVSGIGRALNLMIR